MISIMMHCLTKKIATILLIVAITSNNVQFGHATIVVISRTTNETVFSAEEIGIDAASAYNLKVTTNIQAMSSGTLVIAEPIDVCSEVKPPPSKNHTIIVGTITGQQLRRKDSWILWAVYNYSDDETCSLSRKAKEAEYAGYSAVVITVMGTNDTQGILPSFMGFDWMGVGVYTSLLGENMGNALKKYAYPHKYYLEFENEPYFEIGLLVNFVFLGCLGIVMVVVLLRLSHCLYMRVSSSVQERRRKRKAFLTESQLKKLPVLHWRTSIPQDTCSICIENFEVGEEIRVLPCSHVFHKPCIDPWLIHSSRRCPNCKGKVIFPNEHFSDSSNSDSDSHLEDSDDDFVGNERTPLLRAHSGDTDDQIEDTRFVESQANSRRQNVVQSSSSSNTLATVEQGHANQLGNLIDISSDSEPFTDESFGSFQSAHTPLGKNEALLVDVDCSQSLASAKSFDSEKTFTGNSNLSRKASQCSTMSRKNDDFTSSMGSNASFFSCLESELEKSTASNSQHELFLSFQSS